MPKMKLSAAAAALAICEPGKRKTDYYDDGSACTGLMLEVRSSGQRTWHLRYQDPATRAQRQVKIARFEDATFDQVRRKARQLRSQVVLGGDPAAEKRDRRAVPTFAELADQHVAHARTYMRSWKTLEGYMKRIRKRWGRLRLNEIKPQDVAVWLGELRAGGLALATVEKTRVIMNRSFQLAAEWGIAGAEPSPMRGVPRIRFSNARDTFIDAEQAARLLEAAANTRNPQLPAIVGLLLLTGMRVSELLSTRWADVDLANRRLFIPTSKTGRSRYVPLCAAAVEIVAGAPRPAGAVWLFPNPRDRSRRLTTIKHSWQSAREAAGMPALRIHDLRHSAASALVNSGASLAVVARLLGHASVATSARYSHLADDTLASAVEAGAAKLELARPAA